MHSFLLSALVALELGLVVACLASWLTRLAGSALLAVSHAAIATVAIYSAVIQILLLVGLPGLLPYVEAGLVLGALALYRRDGARAMGRAAGVALDWRWLPFGLLGLVMLAQAVLLPPLNHDSLVYNLARTPLMLAEKRLFVEHCTSIRQVMYNPGLDVVHLLLTRLGSDWFLGWINLLLFVAVIASTLAILEAFQVAKSYWVVSVAVLFTNHSLILQATSPKNDVAVVACAMAGIATVLAVARGLARPRYGAAMLALTLAFGLAAKWYFASLLPPLALLAVGYWSQIRRQPWAAIPGEHWACAALAGAAIAHLGLLGVLAASNIARFGGVFGDPAFVAVQRNPDGLAGMLANAWRYLATMPAIGGAALKEFWLHLHDQVLGLGMRGTELSFAAHYDMTLSGHEDLAGVGPFFYAALVLSPLLLCVLKSRLERWLVAISAFAFLVICYSLSWNPWWARFFPFAVAPLAPLFAIVAERLRLRRLVWVLVAVAAALAYQTFDANIAKNLPNIAASVRDRDGLYDQRNPYVFQQTRFLRDVSGDVLVVAGENDPIYQYFVLAKQARLTVHGVGPYCGRAMAGPDASAASAQPATVIDMTGSWAAPEGYRLTWQAANPTASIRVYAAQPR